MQFKNAYPSIPNVTNIFKLVPHEYWSCCAISEVFAFHQGSFFKDSRYSAVVFTHFTCNVFEMHLQLKHINFYDKDYMGNIIQKLTHL